MTSALIIVAYYGLAPLTATAVEVDKEGERTKLRSRTRRIAPRLRRRGI